MKYKKYWWILALVSGFHSSNAQDVPKIIPPSPNAATLGKFGDTPVELYNGTVDISIPLYSIKEGDIDIPLTLRYQSSGIKVQQEASWVGLGWDFSPAGMITQSVVGGLDRVGMLDKDFYKNIFLKTYRSFTQQEYDQFKQGFSTAYPVDLNLNAQPVYNDFSLYYERSPSEGSTVYTTDERNLLENGVQYGQGQPDIYYVSCPGLSFQFFIDVVTDKPVILNPKALIQIETFPSNSKWVVTNEKGYKYYFDIQETYNVLDPVTTSWLLSKIVSPLGNTITFKYQNYGNEYSMPSYYGELTSSVPDLITPSGDGTHAKIFTHQVPEYMDGSKTSKNYYLSSIETSLETINFNLQPRTDLKGDGARSLKSIDVLNKTGQKIRTIDCNYDYFSYSTIGSSYQEGIFQYNDPVITHTPSLIENAFSKRLKLTSIRQTGYNNLIPKTEGQHTFSYIEDFPLPLKTSCAVDHWGYYNGQNNTGLLPEIKFLPEKIGTTASEYSDFGQPIKGITLRKLATKIDNRTIPLELKGFAGANRAADEKYMMQGMLKDITYPTGGKTSFIWEANRFRNFRIPSVSQTQDLKTAISLNSPTAILAQDYPSAAPSLKTTEFVLDQPTTITLSGQLYKPRNPNYLPVTEFENIETSGVKLFKKNSQGVLSLKAEYYFNASNALVKLETVAGVQRRVFTTTVPLDAGTYVLECDFVADDSSTMPGGPQLYGYVNYKTKSDEQVISEIIGNQDFIGGGLRIKEIAKFDFNGNAISRKTIKYLNEDGIKTSGLLMSPLNYVSSKIHGIGGAPYTLNLIETNWTLHSSSYVPLSNSAMGNLIGYSRIIEEDFDRNGVSNGKIINDYNNQPSRYFADLPAVPNMANGLIKSSKIYSSTQLIKESNYEYQKLLSQYFRSYKVTNVVPPNGNGNGDSYTPGFYYISYYPMLSELNVMSKKNEIDYSNNTQDKVETVTNYTYQPAHFQLLKTTMTDSRGLDNQKQLSYPNEMVSGGKDATGVYAKMISRNIVAPVIEEKIIKNGSTETTTTNYKDWFSDNTIITPDQLITKSNSLDPETRVRYYAYSNKGNPLSLSKEKGVKICYIWGYASQFPIIEVKNADYATVQNALGTTVIQTLGNTNPNKAAIDAAVLTLKTALPDAQIVSYTYDPLIGMTSQTDAKGQTTYYEYDEFQRLKNVKDQNGNIIKNNIYHYKP